MNHKARKDKTAKNAKVWLVQGGVWLSRIIVGVAFIFSGFTKAVDPWGTIFKLEQYLAIWDFAQPRSLLLACTVLLCMTEFILGLSVLTGIYRRSAPRLVMVMMLFFLPLTLYIALKSPVEDCGCFGDALKLSNWNTFFKNVVIIVLTVILIIYNTRVAGILNNFIQWIAAVASGAYIFVIAVIGYMAQPLVDYRPFAEGVDLLAAEKAPEVKIVYEKDGLEKAFPVDSLPAADSGWFYKSRIVDNPSEGSETLAIEDADGEDISDEIIPPEGDMVILVIPESDRWDIASTMYLNRIYDAAEKEGVEMIGVIGGASQRTIDLWKDVSMAPYPIYSGDDTQLKELSRGEMSLVYIKNGRISQKLSLSIISNGMIQNLDRGEITVEQLLDFNESKTLRWLTRIFIIVMVVLIVVSLPERFQKIIRKRPRKTPKTAQPGNTGDSEHSGNPEESDDSENSDKSPAST